MLKISPADHSPDSVTLKLEGRVVGPWVEELRRVCEPIMADERVLKLDFAEVTYVDAEGVAALRGLSVRGATLNRCSPFVEQQIKAGAA